MSRSKKNFGLFREQNASSMRYENGLETRKHILRVAAGMMIEKGYSKTSYQDIAEAAYVSPKSVSYYFGSKKNLLNKILDDQMDFFTEQAAARSEKKHLHHMLAISMIYYFILHDEKYRNFIKEWASGFIFECPLKFDFIQIQFSCFHEYVSKKDLLQIRQGGWTERDIYWTNIARYHFVASHVQEFTHEEVMSAVLHTLGGIYNVSGETIGLTEKALFKEMASIDYEKIQMIR